VEREFQRLTWVDIDRLVPEIIDTVILPVGTIEAHGAIALGTDNIIPESMANFLADKIDALVAPTVNYGITKSLYGYPGSLTISPPIFRDYVKEILKSFHHTGFRKIIVINGHGGNNDALKEAAFWLHTEYQVKIAIIHWWELCADLTEEFYGEQGGHAGLNEAAMVQAVDDSLVNKELHSDDMAYSFKKGADIYPIPGTILLYRENEGMPDYDSDKAVQFQSLVFKEIEKFVKLILDRWAKL
jgi:creatinine amidohydrolase